jgi:DNA-binding winged helix-turn-helix (wHTH) protein
VIYRFGEFEIDTRLYEMRRGGKPCHVEPQVFDVLAYLVRHADRVVGKNELLDTIWPEGYVSEATLSGRVMAARKALGDSGREQRYIKTVHGRGFRFVAPVSQHEETVDPGAPDFRMTSAAPASREPIPNPEPSGPVGRESELDYLDGLLAQAAAGKRTVLLVTGEAGIGKTTLVNAYIDRVRSRVPAWIGQGECIEHHDVAEAYKPVLDALSRISRGVDGGRVVELMARIAPGWLVQLPWLVDDSTLADLQRRTVGATRDRMLREFVEFVEALGEDRSVVLVLEDLHWSDLSTLDLISWIAHRREPARLMVIGSYRPSEVRGESHPLDALQHELRVRGLCSELALPFLTPGAVETYLHQRFAGASFSTDLASHLFQRTDGNPLFVTRVVDAWVSEGLVFQTGEQWGMAAKLEQLTSVVPASLADMIAAQAERLSPRHRNLLEAASVAGTSFCAAAVAAAMEEDDDEVEAACEHLSRQESFIAENGAVDWPDGTLTARYIFTHSLYREVLYRQLAPARRAGLHRKLGNRLKAAHGAHAGEHAVELAMHFTEGRDVDQALAYLQIAAQRAVLLGAHRDAIRHIEVALKLLDRVQDKQRRVHDEITLQSLVAMARMATEGFGSASAGAAYAKALELAAQLDDPNRTTPVIFSFVALRTFQGQHAAAAQLLERVELPQRHAPPLIIPYHALCACSEFHQGAFTEAEEHGRLGFELYEEVMHEPDTRFALLGEDPGLSCKEWSSLALGYLGYPDQALSRLQSLVRTAEEPGRGFGLAAARNYAARLHQLRLEFDATRTEAALAVDLATEHGYAYHRAVGHMLHGWATAAVGDGPAGLEEIQSGIDAHRGTGAELDRPYFLGLLADALARSGQVREGLSTVAMALAHIPRQGYFYEAELRRLRGELLLHITPHDTAVAESEFRAAMDVARSQQARLLELRAATNLAHVLCARGQQESARSVLMPALDWFHESVQLADLKAARALLDTLG